MNQLIEIKQLNPTGMFLVKQLILMFGVDDELENPTLPTNDYISQMLAREDFYVIIALENNKLIGGLTAYEMKMFKRGTTEMFLYEIEVSETYRQKGIGKTLVEFLKNICLEKGIVEIFVGTEKDNPPARKLYTTTSGIADEQSVWFGYKFDSQK